MGRNPENNPWRMRIGILALSAAESISSAGVVAARLPDNSPIPAAVASPFPISEKPVTISTAATLFDRTEATVSSMQAPKSQEPSPTTTNAVKSPDSRLGKTLIGEASYYTRDGCAGCDPKRKMANGEPLDDNALTLALQPAIVKANDLLNKLVTVVNLSTGQSVKAKVTDTGGFGDMGRVADLNLGTKKAIDCPPKCNVQITL